MEMIDKFNPLDTMFKSKKKAAHCGPLSQLKAIKESLLHYNFNVKLLEQRMNMNMPLLH